MDNAAAINANTKLLSKIADNTRLTMNDVAAMKGTIPAKLDKTASALSHLGSSLSKSFSLNSLGSKIGDAFNKGLKSLTNPFKALSGKISSAFTGLKTKLAGFNPIATVKNKVKNVISNPVAAVKNKVKNVTSKPIAAVKTLFGKSDEKLKNTFFKVWSNPKKVAKIWSKEASTKKNMSSANAKAGDKGGGILAAVSKFFTMADKFITKLLIKAVIAFHAVIGPYVFLIIGTIILLAILFKDEIKGLINIFTRVLNIVVDILDVIKGPLGSLLSNVLGVLSDLTEPIREIVNIICDLVMAILKPIKAVVTAIAPIFEKIANFITGFFSKPVETVVDAGKSIVSGVKSVVGGIFGSDTKDEEEGGIILENLFTSVKDTLIEVKDYLLGDAFRENLKSTINYLLDKIYSSKIFKFMEKALNKVFQFYDEMLGIIRAVKEFVGNVVDKIGSFLDGAGNIAKTIFGGVADVAAGIKNKLSSIFESDSNAEAKESNPFYEFIQGFEKMRLDTIQLLSDIKAAVISIEKNKIEIGNALAQNTAQASDGKMSNNIQNITMNYQVDINKVTEKIDKTNEILKGILTNTAINDDGEQKASAVWSI